MKENFVNRVYGADKISEIPIPADYPIKQNLSTLQSAPSKSAKITDF